MKEIISNQMELIQEVYEDERKAQNGAGNEPDGYIVYSVKLIKRLNYVNWLPIVFSHRLSRLGTLRFQGSSCEACSIS